MGVLSKLYKNIKGVRSFGDLKDAVSGRTALQKALSIARADINELRQNLLTAAKNEMREKIMSQPAPDLYIENINEVYEEQIRKARSEKQKKKSVLDYYLSNMQNAIDVALNGEVWYTVSGEHIKARKDNEFAKELMSNLRKMSEIYPEIMEKVFTDLRRSGKLDDLASKFLPWLDEYLQSLDDGKELNQRNMFVTDIYVAIQEETNKALADKNAMEEQRIKKYEKLKQDMKERKAKAYEESLRTSYENYEKMLNKNLNKIYENYKSQQEENMGIGSLFKDISGIDLSSALDLNPVYAEKEYIPDEYIQKYSYSLNSEFSELANGMLNNIMDMGLISNSDLQYQARLSNYNVTKQSKREIDAKLINNFAEHEESVVRDMNADAMRRRIDSKAYYNDRVYYKNLRRDK